MHKPSLIFVSHSHEDNEFSSQLVADLRDQLGDATEVWHDVSGSLKGGDGWWGVIVNKVNACDVFLLVLSPAAQRSDPVGTELDMAWTRKLAGKTRIIPILLERCEIRLDLGTLQYSSFLPPKSYEEALDELIAALFQPPIVSSRLSPTTAPTQSNSPHAPQQEAPPQVLPHVVPTLIVLSIAGVFKPFLVAIASTSLSIGRDPSNDLVLPDPSVSRRHLQLTWTGTGWHLHCAPGVANLFINGARASATDLRNGDQVVIGGTVLRFELPNPSPRRDEPTTHEPHTVDIASTPSQFIVDAPECHFVAPLRESVITLGRGPDNGIVIPSSAVSAHHATLHRGADGRYTIEDAGGRNGIVFQGRRITREVLKSGDRLLIGANLPGRTVGLTYVALR